MELQQRDIPEESDSHGSASSISEDNFDEIDKYGRIYLLPRQVARAKAKEQKNLTPMVSVTVTTGPQFFK